jgi:hypothetical protein
MAVVYISQETESLQLLTIIFHIYGCEKGFSKHFFR